MARPLLYFNDVEHALKWMLANKPKPQRLWSMINYRKANGYDDQYQILKGAYKKFKLLTAL